jgi:transposase
LQERAADVFGAAVAPVHEPPVDLKTLHAKIGQLALENDFSYGLFLQAGRAPSSLPRSRMSTYPT